MLSTDIVRSMISYHHAATRRLWDHIAALSDAQFTAEIPYSHGSVRNHMVHLTSVDRRWLMALRGDAGARAFTLDPVAYLQAAAVRAEWERGAADLAAFAESLSEDDLRFHQTGLPLNTWQVLLHIVNHGTDHRAQVLRALHDHGVATFEQDLVYHFLQQR